MASSCTLDSGRPHFSWETGSREDTTTLVIPIPMTQIPFVSSTKATKSIAKSVSPGSKWSPKSVSFRTSKK